MAKVRVVGFRKQHNRLLASFKKVGKTFDRSFKTKRNPAETFARFTRKKAQTRMRKAPPNPSKKRGLYGRDRMYTQKAWMKRVKKYGASTSMYFKQKGLYSRPGDPPFYHQSGSNFNLKTMGLQEVSKASLTIAGATLSTFGQRGSTLQGKGTRAYITGPLMIRGVTGRRGRKPVPQLHEEGGIVAWKQPKKPVISHRNNVRTARMSRHGAIYPKRPYMKPASKEAIREANLKMKNFTMMKIKPVKYKPARIV